MYVLFLKLKSHDLILRSLKSQLGQRSIGKDVV